MRKINTCFSCAMHKKSAFSLMEMMIVLLIIAIVAAATAPMVTKKMARNAATASGAIEYFGLGNNFGNQGDGTFFLGDTNAHGLNNNDIKMYINSNTNTQPQIGFGANGNPTGVLSVLPTGRIALGSQRDAASTMTSATGDYSIAIGTGATTDFGASIAMGAGATTKAGSSVAIGTDSTVSEISNMSIAIGGAEIGRSAPYSIAMGNQSKIEESANHSIAVGVATVNKNAANSITVGNGAHVYEKASHSIAIGSSAYVMDYSGDNISGNTDSNSIAIGRRAGAGGLVYNLKVKDTIAIGHASRAAAGDAIAIGREAEAGLKTTTTDGLRAGSSIAIGNSTRAGGDSSIAIGARVDVTGGNADGRDWATALGCDSRASQNGATAIGAGARATGLSSIAIGHGDPNNNTNPLASNTNSIAIGPGARATAKNSVAIGAGVNNDRENVIQLGTADQTVYIPGNLVVGRKTVLGLEDDTCVLMREGDSGRDLIKLGHAPESRVMYSTSSDGSEYIVGFGNVAHQFSDRRLKNVGEVFKGGLEELKKLDLYNYTFKKDEKKTPHVGVMAQDLQKVFPNAAWEGEDGYLRIRWDEMFYAVINAVKELDTKITTVFEQIKSNTDKIAKLQAQVDEQQKVIDEQQQSIDSQQKVIDDLSAQIDKQNKEFEKRLAKLEKRTK